MPHYCLPLRHMPHTLLYALVSRLSPLSPVVH
jgi:hypothetical protein